MSARAQAVAFAKLWEKAHAAGMAAGNAIKPRAMIVREDKPGGKEWYVADGVRGFAWVVVTPGNHPFANWAKKNKGARPEYGGGCCVTWVGEFNQSMEKKMAYASAFSMALQEAGVPADSRSRMD